jgi:hypothetical protein
MDPYPREDETTDPEIWMDTIRGVESRATTEQQADGEWDTRRRLLLCVVHRGAQARAGRRTARARATGTETRCQQGIMAMDRDRIPCPREDTKSQYRTMEGSGVMRPEHPVQRTEGDGLSHRMHVCPQACRARGMHCMHTHRRTAKQPPMHRRDALPEMPPKSVSPR